MINLPSRVDKLFKKAIALFNYLLLQLLGLNLRHIIFIL